MPGDFAYFCVMLQQLLTALILLIATSANAIAQQLPVNYFTQPLAGVLQLSGTFAELRSNHFHSGIDLRTESKEGFPVLSCADGYVVRIRVSPYGFGKAVYINHPNGYTTVYAHLLEFNETIGTWVKARQYEKESFDVDLFPPKGALKVSKGEIIARSGNSGSSEGPHLHFEVRETDTEKPVDPVLFGFPIKDFIRPTLQGVRIYPEGRGASVNGFTYAQTMLLAGWGPVYRLKINDTVTIGGPFSLGINAIDLLNETSNRNGVVGYEVLIDSITVFKWKAEKFAFSETRYINSFIDYTYHQETNQRFMRTKVDPGNKLSMYEYVKDGGVYRAEPGKLHHLKVIITDSKKNESILQFFIKAIEMNPSQQNETKQLVGNNKRIVFAPDKFNTYKAVEFEISLPGNCLYDTLGFLYSVASGDKKYLSKMHTVHNTKTPLQEYYEMKIKTDTLKGYRSTQLTGVRINNLNRPVSVGGKYENGWYKIRTRDFGRYAVMIDTTSPVIKPVNFTDGMRTETLNKIQLTISDDLSGISSYRATLNGVWILMDYDAKNKLLTYTRDAIWVKGRNVLMVTVEDGVGNATVSQWELN